MEKKDVENRLCCPSQTANLDLPIRKKDLPFFQDDLGKSTANLETCLHDWPIALSYKQEYVKLCYALTRTT